MIKIRAPRIRGLLRSILIMFAPCASSPCAAAADKIAYAYDALGRLVSATHVGTSSGSGNDGMSNGMDYDALGNRRTYNVTGSKNLGPPQGIVIVVPINGFTEIPVGR